MNLPLQHRLELVTAPLIDPVTIAECKRHMRVEHSDDDVIIGSLINVAVNYLDVTGMLGKAMITQTWAEYIAPNPTTVHLSITPVQSVTSIEYYDVNNVLQTDTLSNYYIIGSKSYKTIYPKSGFSFPVTFKRDDAIKITYVVGFGDTAESVPETVRHAIKMLVANYYENRENELIGTISKTLPFGIEQLIANERSSWVG
jgi:uncharacterized phiE125 gp8 family phage protein